LAKTYLKMNKLDSALIYTKKGFAYATENNIGLWYNKGKIMERTGQTDSAIIIYKKVLTLSPGAQYVQEDLGEVYMDYGYFSKAVSAFEKAIEYNPNDKSFYLRAGYSLERLYDYKKAQELYLKAKVKFPAEIEFSEGYNRMTYKLDRQNRTTSI
jgi:tetratricopeptide (TPR) repeat protein